MATICIAEDTGGKGGTGGGAGSGGQASGSAVGYGSSGYGYPVLECVTGMTTELSVQLTRDLEGSEKSDLSEIDSVRFEARPTMTNPNSAERISVECDFTPDGLVALSLGPEQVDYRNGVWYASFQCRRGDALRQDYRAYLCIRKGMSGSDGGPHTITVMDVRMALMDTSPEMNTLLDDLEFSDMMILHAVQRALDEWEETPPVLSVHFDGTSFPYREHLIKGAVGYLLQSVAYRYMRNRMQYSAAGLSFDKNDKGEVYMMLAREARMEWKNFIGAAKTSLNMNEVFGVVSMPWFGDMEDW